ncbi:tRNA-dihydrouridine synthase [Microbulbifer sp. EKSA008]|uniref:oxidoreductase n=1 Tax=unclassified Microbulbifer TaxID=2619833 RepID=UPI004039B6A9
MTTKYRNLFNDTKIGKLYIPNRLAVAPMTRVSAEPDGRVGPLMGEYYEKFASGGFGLIITEGLYTDKLFSQGYRNQPGMASLSHAESWKPITNDIHALGARVFAQLMHAGALSQHNPYANRTAGPSDIRPLGIQMPFYHGEGPYPIPEAMTQQDISQAVEGFAKAAHLAQLAGFDGVEIHGANGYLLDQFLTAYTNKRQDCFGGSLNNRLRIYKETLKAVRETVGDGFTVGIRFSQKKVNDTNHIWDEGESGAAKVFELVRQYGADYIHTTEPEISAPAFEGTESLSQLAKKYSGLPVIANGGVTEPEQASQVLESNQADIISLGKTALANQDWPCAVKKNRLLKKFNFGMLSPHANLECARSYCQENPSLSVSDKS